MNNEAGVILIASNDPVSKLFSILLDNIFTTVGFYYSSNVGGKNIVHLHLYDVWKCETPIWLKSYNKHKFHLSQLKLSDIDECPFVDKSILYPIKPEYKNRFRIYVSTIINKLPESHNDNNIEWLLCHLTSHKYKNKESPIITGYDVVNFLIRMLDDKSAKMPHMTMEMEEPNHLLNPIRKNHQNQKEKDKILDPLFNEELLKLSKVFMEMLSDDIFVQKLASMKHSNIFYDYLHLEQNLYSSMKKGVNCEDLIRHINEIRTNLGRPRLQKEDFYDDKREDIAEHLISTHQEFQKITKMLGDPNINKNEPIIFQLDKILHHHNAICSVLGLDQIEVPPYYSHTFIVNKEKSLKPEEHQISSLQNQVVTVNSSSLSEIKTDTLIEILKNIEVLVSSDDKFCIMQNRIIKELNKRDHV
jgi:hypothetical protein